jgi:hypothetical protein
MQIKVNTPEDYMAQVSEDKREAMIKLREVMLKNIPEDFQETISYGMIGYVVPHAIFPAGYHCDPKLPLPFVSIAAQKNFIAIYHMGIYSDPQLLEWFTQEHAQKGKGKLDMGKSCIRYKKAEAIPYDLIGELMQKMSVKDWISTYQQQLENSRNRNS